MKFFALLSLLFPFKRIIVMYLISGHSHNYADTLVALANKGVKGKDIFSPEEYIAAINEVSPDALQAEFIDHRKSLRPSWQWDDPLKLLKAVPSSVLMSQRYWFEFQKGTVTMKYLPSSTSPEHVTSHTFCDDPEKTRCQILGLILGPHQKLESSTMASVILPKTELIKVEDSRVLTIQQLYSLMPAQYLPYFPREVARMNKEKTTHRDGSVTIRATKAAVATSVEAMAANVSKSIGVSFNVTRGFDKRVLEAINGATGLGPVKKKRKLTTLHQFFERPIIEKENEEEKDN